MSIYAWYQVHLDYIEIKFLENISTTTLVNANFTMYNTTTATPVSISSPFKTIDVTRDYHSISRTLDLWFNFDLAENSNYEIRIAGLKGVIGNTIANDTLLFETQSLAGFPTYTPPTKDVTVGDIEDFSIKNTSIIASPFLTSNDVSSLVVEDVQPGSDISWYLSESAREGRIDIKFNQSPAANFISTDYFKVQRKLVTRTLVRWEDVAALVTADTENNYVYIYLPSNDATPVYGEPDKVYWESGYKYRVRIMPGIGI